jgi:hypothetical protein
MKRKIVAISIVALMFLGMLAVFPVAHAVDRVYLQPTSKDLTGKSVGDTFYVYVWAEIADPPALFTWEVKLLYPTAWLDCIGAGYSDPGVNPTEPYDAPKSEMFRGHATVPVEPIIDDGAGFVMHGESLMGADKASGNKRLMWAQFRITDEPGKLEQWTGAIDSNHGDTYLLDPGLNSVPIQKGKCDLTFNWVEPTTKPKLGWYVTPYGKGTPENPVWDSSKDWYCTNVDKEVRIKNLAGAWDLTTASFIVHLDLGTYLTFVSVSLKPNWAGSAVWDEGTSTITVSVTWTGGSPPSGAVPVIDIILHIEDYPEYPAGPWTMVDTITDVAFNNHIGPVPYNPPDSCTQKLEGFLAFAPAWIEVEDVTVGPGPVLCTEVKIPIRVFNPEARWNLIGVQFRINYDTELVEPICADEGPFLGSFVNDGELGTFFIVYHEPDDFGPHTIIGNMIFPDGEGIWHAPYPVGNGIVAWLKLHIIKDIWPGGFTMPLHIFDILIIGLDEQQNIIEVALDEAKIKDGTLTVYHELPGRVIDVYGGIEGEVFPAPYGGQGPNNPMDLVYPQKEVILYVDVSYNWWPVQQKDVGFEIEGPYYHGTNIKKPVQRPFLLKLTNRTDSDGRTWVKFRIPWYCDNPDEMLGQYHVTVTVDIACVVVMDTLVFDFDYVQRFWKVTVTPPPCGNGFFNHCDEVEITVKFGTYAQQTYPDLLVVVIYDELGVPIGMAMVEMEIGGATFCSYKNYTVKVKIHIPKWAFVGVAKIHVMCFDKDPTEGGIPWCPEYKPYPEIFIGPY